MIKIDELDDNLCMTCCKNFKHKKYYYKNILGIKECELILNCATCRNILRRKKDIDNLLEERKTLAKIRVNQEWKEFINNLSE